ncbi:MAG TPA: hypothetical protein VJP77_06545, partial [Planctomycetota bacterium]|nr:hypothetical protein [Planctomycetota bacterium]
LRRALSAASAGGAVPAVRPSASATQVDAEARRAFFAGPDAAPIRPDGTLDEAATVLAIQRRHLLWPARDLLEAYGAPDALHATESGISLFYKSVPVATGFAAELHFIIRDSLVATVLVGFDRP